MVFNRIYRNIELLCNFAVFQSFDFMEWRDLTLEEWTALTDPDGNSTWQDPNLFYMTTYCEEGEVGIHMYNEPGIDSVELFISDLENNDQGLFFIDWNDIKHLGTDYNAPYVFNIQQLPSGRYMFFARAYTSEGEEMTSDRIEYQFSTGIHPPFNPDGTQESDFHLNPNPNKGRFELITSSEYRGRLDVRIYNTLGQQIYSEPFIKDNREAVINIALDSRVEAGVYMVQLVLGGSQMHKFVAIY